MADFASTNASATFEEWFEQIELMCELNFCSAGSKGDWRKDYDAGKAVDQAIYDEFGSDMHGE